MEWLTRIGLATGRLVSFLMRLAGLASAVDLLLIRPDHASAPEVLLSGVLLLGGQATKDLLLGLADRLLSPVHHPPEPPAEKPPATTEVEKR